MKGEFFRIRKWFKEQRGGGRIQRASIKAWVWVNFRFDAQNRNLLTNTNRLRFSCSVPDLQSTRIRRSLSGGSLCSFKEDILTQVHERTHRERD